MELATHTEMFDVLKDLGHYSGTHFNIQGTNLILTFNLEAVASAIFKQILAGINYLHQSGVCHRDLKPNNILVSKGINIFFYSKIFPFCLKMIFKFLLI